MTEYNSGSFTSDNLNMLIQKRMPFGFQVVYANHDEIQNYNQAGSLFNGMTEARILVEITNKAIELGLPQENVVSFLEESDLFNHLTSKDQKFILRSFTPELYFSGPLDVATELKNKYVYKTIPDPDRQGKNEPVYVFNGKVFVRAEEKIKAEASSEFLNQWREMLQKSAHEIEKQGNNADPKTLGLRERLMAALHRGPSIFEISEVMETIRRSTFTDEKQNPSGYIPFENGLLDTETWMLQPFDPSKFYTYWVHAKYLDRRVSFCDMPLFRGYMGDTYSSLDIPMIIEYMGYSFLPDRPRDKTLWVVGREGIGKGVADRLMDALLGEGKGAMDINRLMTADKFQFTGLSGHVLLTDPEVDRQFRKGSKISTRSFNTLFGNDSTFHEKKFGDGKKEKFEAKGIFLSNLPLFYINDMAFIRRVLLIQTLQERTGSDDPEIDKKIITHEGDLIATFAIQLLKRLKARNLIFTNEMTNESTSEIWDIFANPVQGFIDEFIYDQEGSSIPTDNLYEFFVANYCKPRGIVPPKKHPFVEKINDEFEHKKSGSKKRRYNVIMGIGCIGLEGTKMETIGEMGTKNNIGKPCNTGLARDKRYGVHIRYMNLYKGGIKNSIHDNSLHARADAGEDVNKKNDIPPIQEYVPEMDTDKSQANPSEKTLKNKGLETIQHDEKQVSISHEVPKSEKSKKTGDSKPEPTKSDVQSEKEEKKPFTIPDGDTIRDQLLNMRYLLDPSLTGLAMDNKHYGLAVRTPDHDKMEKLLMIMAKSGFVQQNTGAMGYLFFTKEVLP